jgi:anti-anti-sigma factor
MSYRELARITVETVEEARLVRVAGEVDASTAGALRRSLRSDRGEHATLLLDLSDVCFLDSSGLRVRRLIVLTGTASELALVESHEPMAA